MIKYIHISAVLIFLIIYIIKTALLLLNKKEQLASFTKIFRIPEMAISFLFLATGIYLLTQQAQIDSLLVIKLIAVFASIPIAIIGFKKSNKVMAVIAVLLIIGAYGLAEVRKSKLRTLSGNTSGMNSGQAIYTQLCVRCHGEDGKAGLMGATDLSLSQLDDASIASMIKNGKNSMPAFGSQLNDAQVTAVTEYVKKLRK